MVRLHRTYFMFQLSWSLFVVCFHLPCTPTANQTNNEQPSLVSRGDVFVPNYTFAFIFVVLSVLFFRNDPFVASVQNELYSELREVSHLQDNTHTLKETNTRLLSRQVLQSDEVEEDEISCDLSFSERGRFYNEEQNAWIVDNNVLEELDNDLQRLISCTTPDDVVLFQTRRTIRPRRTIFIPWNLTLSSAPNGPLLETSSIAETLFKTRMSCPESGDLLIIRSNSIVIANIQFRDCNQTGNIVVLNPTCEDTEFRNEHHLVYVEFRNLSLSRDQAILKKISSDEDCSSVTMQNAVFHRNLCDDQECVVLGLSNTLSDIRMIRNRRRRGFHSHSFIRVPTDSETIATNISGRDNRIRLFHVVDSTFSIANSHFESNTLSLSNRDDEISVGGTVFLLNNSALSIVDSIFEHNAAVNGGVIYISDSELSINNSVFHENDAGDGNGGVIFALNGSTSSLQSSFFSGNKAYRGAALFTNESVSTEVYDSRFWENLCSFSGCLYVVNGTMSIESSSFVHNNATHGGSCLVTSTVNTTISNTTFLLNNGTYGGACYFQFNSTARIRNVLFEENHGHEFGGAFYSNSTDLTVVNTSFHKNWVGNDAGVFYAFASNISLSDSNITESYTEDDATIMISNCSMFVERVLFVDNVVEWYGGVYCYSSNLTVKDSVFLNCSSYYGAGVYLLGGSTVNVSNSSFRDNVATRYGAAIYSSRGHHVSVDQTEIINSEADDGGGVFLFATNSTFFNVSFIGNRARGGSGGGLYVDADGADLKSLIFMNNTSLRWGGGMYAQNIINLPLSQVYFYNNSGNFGGGIGFWNLNLDLKSPCTFLSNLAATSGGGLFQQTATSSVSSCEFDSNLAQFGGSVWIGDGSTTEITNCSFNNHTVVESGGTLLFYNGTNASLSDSTVRGSNAGAGGGAILIQDSTTMSITSVRISKSRAQCGGGIRVINATLFLNDSSLNGCQSVESGGGICSTNSTVRVQRGRFRRNRVSDGPGGGIYLEDGGSIVARNLMFWRNQARESGGGGIAGVNITLMNLKNIELEENRGRIGGGLYTFEVDRSSFHSINFTSNTAIENGGGANIISPNKTVNFRKCIFTNNRARQGGGLVLESSNASLSRVEFMKNEALSNGGGILALSETRLIVSNTTLHSNQAMEIGGGACIVSGSSLLCINCVFHNNTAERGGGLFVADNDTQLIAAQVQNSTFDSNAASTFGGALEFDRPENRSINCLHPTITCSHVVLLNTEIQNNQANASGAAVLTSDPEGVLVSCDQESTHQEEFLDQSQLSSLQILRPSRMCENWLRNELRVDGVGSVVGTYGRELSFSTEFHSDVEIVGDVESGFTLRNVRSGQRLPDIIITILDAYGMGPVPTSEGLMEVTMVSLDGFFQGIISTNVTEGSGKFSRIVGFKPPGNYSLQVIPNSEAFLPVILQLHVRGCQVGEEPTTGGELCQRCDAVSYNFDPTEPGGCTSCPEEGTCGGNYIVPRKGHWHKSPCHANVKECLLDEACDYENRQQTLTNFTNNFTDCNMNQSTLEEYGEVLCADGYEGPLCGSCKESYGLSLGFKCTECPHEIESLLTVVFFAVYLLGIAGLTVRGGLPFVLKNSTVSRQSIQLNERALQPSDDVEINIQMVEMLRDGHVPAEYIQQLQKPTTSRSVQRQQTNELEMTRWMTTEIFKIIINFLQVTAIAAAINVGWTEGMLNMFEASEYIGALTTAALARPIDCIVSSNSAEVRSIWRTLLSLCVPMAVMGIFGIIWITITARENKGMFYFWKRLLLSIIAVTYISYLGLTKLAVRVFYCVDVYDSKDPFSDSQNKFWAVDTSIQCYERQHFALIVIAVIVLVVVTMCFPLISAIFLSHNKTQHRQSGSWTMETMGFLFRAFKEEFVFWESLIMLRKAFLSIIVVFSYPLGGQSQGLLALAVVLFCLYIHLICSPFRKEFHTLNYYESASLLVSCFTLIFGQFFDVERASDSTKVFIAVLIILVNSLFFCFLLFAFFQSAVHHLKVILQYEGCSVSDHSNWLWIIKKYLSSRFSRFCFSEN